MSVSGSSGFQRADIESDQLKSPCWSSRTTGMSTPDVLVSVYVAFHAVTREEEGDEVVEVFEVRLIDLSRTRMLQGLPRNDESNKGEAPILQARQVSVTVRYKGVNSRS